MNRDELRDKIAKLVWESDACHKDTKITADQIISLIEGERENVRENETLRKLLWLNHGCPFTSLYGDDGEMQCHKCMIDFKRMSADGIEGVWAEKRMRNLVNALEGKEAKDGT